MYRALLVALIVAAVAMGAAYTFGPDAQATPAKAKPSKTAKATRAAAAGSADPKDCPADTAYPKRQLRGVWIATVRNLDWPSRAGLTQAQQKAQYTKILDSAVKRRLNAVFVQVRPASDAIYRSPYEPWSQSLTGTAGKDPGWDPLPFLIDEAHKRGLEFHAWFNPYRAAIDTTSTASLPAGHPAREHPGWIVKYGDGLYYNPGLPEVRDYVTKVVDDVVRRYDVDGVHFDDYFYPYPVQGAVFNDTAAFRRYGGGQSLADWRRANVDKLIAQVSDSVHETKRWVKFGVSPFGIWRNKSDDPKGSATHGMSAYDTIYADPLAWIKAGDVDYIVPQLYWPRGYSAADYSVLAPWWAKQVAGTDVQLYIGQALYLVGTRDVKGWTGPGELPAHLALNRKYPEIKGDVFFSAKQLLTDPLGVMNRIAAGAYKRPALVPRMPDRGSKPPAKVQGLSVSGNTLSWQADDNARSYVVYRVAGKGDDCATASARNMVAVVPSTGTARQTFAAKAPGTYYVTALDRLSNESAPMRITVPGH